LDIKFVVVAAVLHLCLGGILCTLSSYSEAGKNPFCN